MKRNILLCLLFLSLCVSLPCEGGLFRDLGSSSHPWHFDGRGFVPGGADSDVVILVRDGYLPVLRGEGESAPEVALPAGMGAIAGICYIQTSGGKLAPHGGTAPAGGYRLEILGPDRQTRYTTADRNGFFALPLPTGIYEVRGGGGPVQLMVTAGKTALVALRTGKRMVD